MLAHVRAELGVELLVAALAGQVQVHLAQRGQEAVRVADRERPVLAVVDLQLVVERQLGAGDRALEHAGGMGLGELGRRPVGGDHAHRARRRAERADHDAAVAVGMGSEEGVWIGRGARGELLGVGHALLLTDPGPRKLPGHPGRRLDEALTPRERDIAELVAQGRSNKQAAAALFLSEKTIEHHLSRIYAKVGVRSRVELAARLAR